MTWLCYMCFAVTCIEVCAGAWEFVLRRRVCLEGNVFLVMGGGRVQSGGHAKANRGKCAGLECLNFLEGYIFKPFYFPCFEESMPLSDADKGKTLKRNQRELSVQLK